MQMTTLVLSQDIDAKLTNLAYTHQLSTDSLLSLRLPILSQISDKLKPESEIDEGAGGTIIKCKDLTTRNSIVVKKFIRKERHLNDYYFTCINEYLTLKKADLAKGDVVKAYSLCLDINPNSGSNELQCCLLTDYYKNGDLLNLVMKARKLNMKFTTKMKDYIFLKILSAVKFLHYRGIVHRDLKPENFLLDSQGELKLGDFGYAMDINNLGSYPITNTFLNMGTKSFKSPELFTFLNWSQSEVVSRLPSIDFKKIDVWALGILYFQIVTLSKPWMESSESDETFVKFEHLYKHDKLNQLDNFKLEKQLNIHKFSEFNELNTLVRSLIVKMLNPDPTERLTMREIFRTDWAVQTNVDYEEFMAKHKRGDEDFKRLVNAKYSN
ncbi:unnamed protein product [Ambrosiozyma monospora]|uniref:Unnamed protein product n=1 Tax=Ambrosiozyma monospora TaxID=43982 RepID=A0A9W7DGF8_AMBMO|nr:unnamed protein product [Ambrosiozyma monospora]